MSKNKKGIDKKEYPKLIRVDGIKNKILVNNVEEEAKYFPVEAEEVEETKPKSKKSAEWGSK